jgi:hypothetical protein
MRLPERRLPEQLLSPGPPERHVREKRRSAWILMERSERDAYGWGGKWEIRSLPTFSAELLCVSRTAHS